MNLRDVETLARELMTAHGLTTQGWRFQFDNARRRFGLCDFRLRVISLSRKLCELNTETEVRDTVLHEIAHALVGHGHGHNAVWQRCARDIGSNGQRCYSAAAVARPPGLYVATCVGCQRVVERFRRPRSLVSCGLCSGGRFNPQFVLTWKKRS